MNIFSGNFPKFLSIESIIALINHEFPPFSLFLGIFFCFLLYSHNHGNRAPSTAAYSWIVTANFKHQPGGERRHWFSYTQIESLTSWILRLYNECGRSSFCTEGHLRCREQGETTFRMVAPFWLQSFIKVKDNNHELVRVSRRIEHVVLSIGESRDCDILRSEEYNDALTTIFEYVVPISKKLRWMISE